MHVNMPVKMPVKMHVKMPVKMPAICPHNLKGKTKNLHTVVLSETYKRNCGIQLSTPCVRTNLSLTMHINKMKQDGGYKDACRCVTLTIG